MKELLFSATVLKKKFKFYNNFLKLKIKSKKLKLLWIFKNSKTFN